MQRRHLLHKLFQRQIFDEVEALNGRFMKLPLRV